MSLRIGLGREPGLKPGRKKIAIWVGCILLVLFSMSGWAYGQTFGEFFNQKKTQRKYFAEQLAAIQLYAGYLKKGYEIGRDGIQAVRDITNGEFGLHELFISSLSKVSPVISRHKKVAEVIAMQLEMVSVFRSLAKLDKLEPMTLAYIASVGGSMLESSLSDIDVLMVIITSGKLELDEEERLMRLDDLHRSVEEKYHFVRWFRDDVIMLNHQRDRMLKDAGVIGGLHEK
ncbi:hypothetical protein DBR40_07090 [Pedobacter sp. KBW01]|uniref:hypothetical protein n=1 Tax=Pedobacter sp. KBW01 TaxID=2153364 RepID=UPI000F5B6207|nr:hypothetical protein [Pedobacter sp. KBW01]RQO77732.1 hypothetical protein DBR40_07090 [Pedobacter sp. KBW01]